MQIVGSTQGVFTKEALGTLRRLGVADRGTLSADQTVAVVLLELIERTHRALKTQVTKEGPDDWIKAGAL